MEKKKIETRGDCYWYTWGGDFRKGFACYPREYGARCEFFKNFFGYEGLSCEGCKAFIKDDGERTKPKYFYQFKIEGNLYGDYSDVQEILEVDSDEKAVLEAKKELKKQIEVFKQRKKGIRVFKLIHEEKA